jgi:hypothetical protein
MILVDTSVWIEHLRRGNDQLASLLGEGKVRTHPFVIGELACGHLDRRTEILRLLTALPAARVAEHPEVLHLVEAERLRGRRLGWIDLHLLASARLSACLLWTLDRSLQAAASALRVAK